MTMTKTLSLLGFLALTGCGMMKGKGEAADPCADPCKAGGGGGGLTPADNMADAPVVTVGDSLTSALACNGSGYLKVDAPAGEAFQIEVNIQTEGACVNVSHLNSNGGAQNGGQMFGELCESQTLDVTGLDGGSYIQIFESGACKGATVDLALK